MDHSEQLHYVAQLIFSSLYATFGDGVYIALATLAVFAARYLLPSFTK